MGWTRALLAALVLALLLGGCHGDTGRRFDYGREMDGGARGCDS